jgi:cell division protein FtsI/penicillin-binding protein 2
MLRRDAVAMLLGACGGARRGAWAAAGPDALGQYLEPAAGAALLVDVRARRLIAVHNPALAGEALLPPGSTLKPFVLASLMAAGKLRAEESFPCPGKLAIAGHSLDCSHPRLAEAMRLRTAVAYSCNCFVAQMAARFDAGELARELDRAGFRSPTGLLGPREVCGRLRNAATPDATKLQALGEEGVVITLAELALGYRQLALRLNDAASLQPVLEGLEDAVAYGTAQRALIPGATVAGKTGSVRTAEGVSLAWFAGFVPSRTPEVVVAVVLQGHSGGSDAAPVGGRILEAWRAGKR